MAARKTPSDDVGLEQGADMRELFGYWLPWEYRNGHAQRAQKGAALEHPPDEKSDKARRRIAPKKCAAQDSALGCCLRTSPKKRPPRVTVIVTTARAS